MISATLSRKLGRPAGRDMRCKVQNYEYQNCGFGTIPRWLDYSWVCVKRNDLVFRKQWGNCILAVMEWMADRQKILGPTVSGGYPTASFI